MNELIMKQTGFEKEVQLVKQNRCPICGKDVNVESFKDALSRKEFFIRGICQPCQDEIF